ncbi:MAG: DUF3048 domain-containing protein [Aquihabitans sp.]
MANDGEGVDHDPDEEVDDGDWGDEAIPGGIAVWWAGLSTRGRQGVVGGIVAVLLVVAVVAALVLTGGDEEVAAPPTSTTTTTEVITTTTEPDTGPVAPLTGLRIVDANRAARPALAVKIDNLDAPQESALPQAGLPKADIVFEEIVEGNITRLVAVFQSQDPGNRVGPVRSARTTDIHILPQLGRTLLAWSGGNGGVVAAVRETDSIIDLGHDRATSAYSRDRSRKAPHNLYVDADALWGFAPDEVTAPDPIFEYRHDEAMPKNAVPAPGVDITWGGGGASSPVGWRWDPTAELYVRYQSGRIHLDETGDKIVAQNVVVLVTPYGQSPADLRSPEALTVGSDRAFVFTNGMIVRGRWERDSDDVPATLTSDGGEVIRLTPGQTWIELPRDGGVTVSERGQ